jgi:hypothetical protein
MALESPPRLKLDPELGPTLTAADADVELDATRLAAGAAAIKAAITRGGSRPAFAWWKLGIPIAVLLGAVVIVRQLQPDDVAAPPASITPDAAPAAPADALIAVIEPAVEPPVDLAPPAPAVDNRPARRARPIAAAPPIAPDAAPATSELPEQIRLYEEARAAGRRGELALGLERLDDLLSRFPSTQLRAEAELTRAEFLTRAGRLDDAAASLDRLIADSAHAGRRGELLRALGDLRRKQGNCPAAVDAYTLARAEKLGEREQAKVTRGLERCATSP